MKARTAKESTLVPLDDVVSEVQAEIERQTQAIMAKVTPVPYPS